MALSSYDKQLSASQQAQINKYTSDWNAAKAKGDKAGMDKAHAAAESIRNQAGYSGGSDGSKYNPTTSTKPPSTTNASSSGNSTGVTRHDGQGSNRFSGSINYGGQSIELSRDYQSDINTAIAKGDYATAKQLEDARNAKINYLNSSQGNYAGTHNWNTSNNYSYNSFSDLPSTWSSANVGGNTYTNQNGKYYDSDNNFLGTGWNSSTGAFTYNDRTDAANAARQYIVNNNSGLSNYGLEATDYYDKATGGVSSSFIEAMQNGTADSWQQQRAKKKAEEEYLASLFAQELQQFETLYNAYPVVDTYTPETNALSGQQTSAQQSYSSGMSNYLDYINKQIGKSKVSKY